MAEIDDAELETLRRAHKLLDGLYNDPKHGMAFKRMMKEKIPDAKIPELDIIEQVTKPYDERMTALEAENKKLHDELELDRKTRKEREEEDSVKLTLAEVQKKYKLTDEGMQKVIDRMKEKNNPDAEAVAAWLVSQQPAPKPVTPTGYQPSELNLFGSSTQEEQYADLHKDPLKWFDKQVADILSEDVGTL